MLKRKLTIKRNAVFDLNIRSIAIKNKEEYLNDLKMQAIRLQIEKIVHMDPMLKTLFNNNDKPIKYARPLNKNQINRSFQQNQIQLIDQIQRAKSTEGQLFGDQCTKSKRLNSKGTLKVHMHRMKIVRRFRKLVYAVFLLLTYFRFYPLIKKGKRYSKQRVSILRSKAILDRPLLMPQIVQSDQIDSENESEFSKDPTMLYKKKHSSLGNYDTFLRRPIQQFILRQNTELYSQKRICKTEHSQVQSMYNFNKKLKLNKVYQKSSSIKILSI